MFVHSFLCLAIGSTVLSGIVERSVHPASSLPSTFVSLQGNNRIGGHVFDRQRRPVAQLDVELQNDLGQTIRQTRTNNSGRYEFVGLSQGVFQIRVRTHGTNYISQTERVEIINFGRSAPGGGTAMSGSQYIPIDFTLRTEETKGERAAPEAVFAQTIPDEARRVYEQATGDFDRGKKDEGLAGLQKAVELFPNYFLALERLGTEYVKREEYEPARLTLTRAIEVNSRAQQSLYWLGLAQHHLKQSAAAIESLTRALALAPNSVNTHMWLGIVYRMNSKSELAEKHLKRAKELGNNRVPDAHWHLALLYNKLGRNGEAADELELFLKAQPESRDTENIKKLIKQLREKANQATGATNAPQR